MDDKEREKARYEKLGFKPQKEIIYNKLLPYADRLDNESLKLYTDIKTNLIKSVLLREMRPGCLLWISRLNKYMKIYGLKFSKEDHIALIKLMYEFLTIPNLEPNRINKFATTLTHLLKKVELISPDELQLPWRPLYNLCERIMTSSQTSVEMYRYFSSLETTLDYLVHYAKIYFPPSATQEILDELRPKLCPFDNNTITSAIECLEWFLPVTLPPSLAHCGYKLWFKEFMDLWETCHNAPAWESDMMWIMAKLASHNVGRVDWEPYLPIMFTRFLRSLNLPVSYRQKLSPRHHKIETTPMCAWIIATIGNNSSTFKYLEKFIQTIESYYHPANTGRWASKLREVFRKLPYYLVERLYTERHKKTMWEYKIPDSHKITEQEIDTFVEIMKPIIVHAIYSRQGTSEVSQALQHLATLRPNIVVPLVLDKIYSTLDSLTEPHKLTASMQCLVSVARPMVQGAYNGYPEGPSHVITLLNAVLPGIDPNDIRKCFVTFQFISTFISMIPLVDSSNASNHWKDLTEEEHVICEATTGFEDFVMQFLDKVFTLVESSSLEMTRMEQVEMEKRSKLESMAESALSSTCVVIITQTSPQIFKSALRKLFTFISEHILETRVSGQMIAIMCRSFTRVNPDDTLKLLVPYLCDRLDELLGQNDDILKEETLDNEILYNLLLLSEMIDCVGSALMPYIDRLTAILDRTLHLTCNEGGIKACRLLDHMMMSLTIVQVTEYRSVPIPLSLGVQNHLYIRDWGKPGNLLRLNLKWYQPGDKEIACVQALLERYLLPELDRLNNYLDGKITLTREELRRSLHIVLSILGAQTVLPMWSEPAIQLVSSKLEPWAFEMMIGINKHVTMPDGSNVRKAIINILHNLQRKILQCAEDDIKSLFCIISIWDILIMNKFRGRNFESHWKNFHLTKKILEDRLHGNKKHLRQLLVDRVMLHQEFRTETRSCSFTNTHKQILIDLYTLSTSHYSEVRIKAQKKLFAAIGTFPYSYTAITPCVVKSLQIDSNINHEEFKGCLYVVLGPKSTPLAARHDWTFVRDIWPLLVKSKPSEKPSVINLMSCILEAVHKHFPTISIEFDIPDTCLDRALALGDTVPNFQRSLVSPEQIEAGLDQLKKIIVYNKKVYNEVLDLLLDAILHGNLHWRYHRMALSFLRDLVHPDINYNERIVRYVLQTLVHESLDLRKIAIRVTGYILKQHKQKHKKISIDPYSFSASSSGSTAPGFRPDNAWMQYNSETRPLDEAEWNKPRYLHKHYNGYYMWPKTVNVYAPPSEQPSLDQDIDGLSLQAKEIHYFFSNQQNVDKLIDYLSMEEKKGKDKFNPHRFMMFKSLFRNHGDAYLPNFIPHLQTLVSSKEEHHQRCAAELIAGLIRGCKHWPFDKVTNLWSVLTPVIKTALSNMTVETIPDWGECFATSAESRDPNRYHWLHELLMDNPLKEEASFMECGRLYVLQGAITQQIWRVSELVHRLLKYLNEFLMHPYQNVRERISSILTNIFELDMTFPAGNPTIAPRIADFMDEIVPQLNILYVAGFKDVKHVNHVKDDNIKQTAEMLKRMKLSNDERDVAIRLFKTVSKYVIGSINRLNYGCVAEYYKLFPLACLLQSYEADEELSLICSSLLAVLSQSMTLPAHMPTALNSVKVVSESQSWSARAASAEYIQVLVFYNMATVLSNNEWVKQVKDIVLKLLEDENPEVRMQASQVLGGLLHCQFIPYSLELLDNFKHKAKTKLKKRSLQGSSQGTSAIRIRHSGVLGLCAFINAHPYDVPEYLPDVLQQLGAHLNDPQPIPATIRKTLGDFKRTHHDNWEVHQLHFTEEELSILSDLTVPPSYYA